MNNTKNTQINIYFCDVSPLEDEILYSEYYSKCSNGRKEKTDRLRLKKDKQLSVGAEYILRYACKDFGIDFYKQNILYGEKSKPYFENCDINYNISHSGNFAMCIMSYSEVGCDIEKRAVYNLDTAQRFFHKNETEMLCECKTDEEMSTLFCKIWTLKESYIKCCGKGLSMPLNSFSVVENHHLKHTDKSFYLYENKLNSDYQYAFCINCENFTDIKDISIQTKTVSFC